MLLGPKLYLGKQYVVMYLIGVTPWQLGRNELFSPGHTDKKAVLNGGSNAFFQLFFKK
jgi:hypothetical protein